jgi:hypothetical protein
MGTEQPKKDKTPFKEYFLQFLMLFLAVILGAIGENYREQYTSEVVERNMERETLQAMANDLNTDMTNLDKSIKNKEDKEVLAKKLIDLISMKKIAENMPAVYDLLPSQTYYDNAGSFVTLLNNTQDSSHGAFSVNENTTVTNLN